MSRCTKAVRIGSGPNTVIEFTDPDNPHGRKAAQFLAGRTDVTRHVFLIVSPGSRKAEPSSAGSGSHVS